VLVHERAYRKNIKLRARGFFFLQIWLPPKRYEPQFILPSRNSLVGSQILYTQMRDHQDLLFALQRNSQMNVQSCLWPLGNHATSSQLPWLKSGGQLMVTAAEFRKYAAECNRTAKVSQDPETKALWRRMEERWLLCVKLAEEDEQSVARTRAQRAASRRHSIGGPLSRRN